MAILTSKDGKELIATCNCGCEEGFYIKIGDSLGDFSFMCFINGNFFKDQYGSLGIFKNKCKKIFAIIRNKDFYYSDIVMSKEDYQEFKDYVNRFGE